MAIVVSPARETLRGIVLMIASQLAFLFNDTFVKLVGEALPLGEVIFLRGCFAALFIVAVAWSLGQHRGLAALWQRSVAGRITGELGGTIFYLVALFHIPIATVIIIFQATPLAVTAAAAIVLKQAVGWRRWLAILIGFAGVLLVVRPGLAGFEPYGLLVLVSVLFVTFRDISTRAMPASVPTLLVSALTATAVMLMGAAIGVTETWVFPTWQAITQLAGAAAFIAVGYFTIIAAMRTGDLAVTAPFRYVSVVFAILIGHLVWGDVPDAMSLLGSAVIVAAGIYTFLREQAAHRAVSGPAALPRREPDPQ